MGGCASKPKGMDLHPTDVPATPTSKPQAAETISQGNTDGGESAAAPLVDLSETNNEPKQDKAGGDVEPAPGAPTSDLNQAEKVEAIAKGSEDNSEASVQNTQVKEGQPGTTEADADATPTPTSEHKTVAPIVAV